MTAVPSWSCSKAVYKPIWHVPLLSVQWINSWWWTDELSETCRVSCQNKFVKLVHLVGFITKKFVKMYGHMNEEFAVYRFQQEQKAARCRFYITHLAARFPPHTEWVKRNCSLAPSSCDVWNSHPHNDEYSSLLEHKALSMGKWLRTFEGVFCLYLQ